MQTSDIRLTKKIKSTDYIVFKKKRIARIAVTRALRMGHLVRSHICQLCETECKTNAHHIDYGKPLQVMWVCDQCHGKCHRLDSPYNPKNNYQTSSTYAWNQSDMVTISFNIPIKQFMILKEKAKENNKKLSNILREDVIKKYPVESSQLEFNFEDLSNDSTQPLQDTRIQDMGSNKNNLLQQKRASVSSIWREGDNGLSQMEERFCKVL